MSDSTKPPAQRMVVEGIDAHGSMGGKPFDYGRLCRHPPFQAFIEQAEPHNGSIPSDRYAAERLSALLGHLGHDAAMALYLTWWGNQGRWKGEDPMGGA